jgi:hypothetical protein
LAADLAAFSSLETTSPDFLAATENSSIREKKEMAVMTSLRHFSVSSDLEKSENSDTRGINAA